MNAIVTLPEAFAARFGTAPERDRHVLEVLARDEYRAGRLTPADVQSLLGFMTTEEAERFLQGDSTQVDKSNGDRERGVKDLVEEFRSFAAAHPRGDMDIVQMIRDSRR